MVQGDEDYYNTNIRELKFLQDALKEKYGDYLCQSEVYNHSFFDGFTIVKAFGGNLDEKKKKANRWLIINFQQKKMRKRTISYNQL